MNREETADRVKIMAAYVAGEEIEYQHYRLDDDWYRAENPAWNWNEFNYRVKPKIKPKLIEMDQIWVAVEQKGLMTNTVVCDSLEKARIHKYPYVVVASIKEVIECGEK